MEMKFQKGDVVRLKSGGPDITVHTIKMSVDVTAPFERRQSRPSEPTGILHCQWFEGKKLVGRDFHQDLLELVRSNPEGAPPTES